MYPVESYKRKRSRNWIYRLLIVLSILIPLYFVYLFKNEIYYRLAGDDIRRIHVRIELTEERLISRDYPSDELMLYIEESRKLAESRTRMHPGEYINPYYEGLFLFYELLLRVPLNSDNLIRMTSEGYLPSERFLPVENLNPVPELAANVSKNMRKALAIRPDMAEKNIARFAIILGDLFSTGRTDPILLDLLTELDDNQIRPAYRNALDWTTLSLYVFFGKTNDLEKLLTGLTDNHSSNHLVLSEGESSLIQAQAYFYNGNYLQTIRLTRSLLRNEQYSTDLRSLAALLEGETFLIQQGPRQALRYFILADTLAAGKDTYIASRVKNIQTMMQ